MRPRKPRPLVNAPKSICRTRFLTNRFRLNSANRQIRAHRLKGSGQWNERQPGTNPQWDGLVLQRILGRTNGCRPRQLCAGRIIWQIKSTGPVARRSAHGTLGMTSRWQRSADRKKQQVGMPLRRNRLLHRQLWRPVLRQTQRQEEIPLTQLILICDQKYRNNPVESGHALHSCMI